MTVTIGSTRKRNAHKPAAHSVALALGFMLGAYSACAVDAPGDRTVAFVHIAPRAMIYLQNR